MSRVLTDEERGGITVEAPSIGMWRYGTLERALCEAQRDLSDKDWIGWIENHCIIFEPVEGVPFLRIWVGEWQARKKEVSK